MKKIVLTILVLAMLAISSPVSAATDATADEPSVTTNSLEDPGGGRP